MSKRGHHPQRTCLGCGLQDEQSKLIRLFVADRGNLKIDKQGTGRGGYLHQAEECWRAFLKRKSLRRAFHVEINKGAKEELIQELKERHWE